MCRAWWMCCRYSQMWCDYLNLYGHGWQLRLRLSYRPPSLWWRNSMSERLVHIDYGGFWRWDVLPVTHLHLCNVKRHVWSKSHSPSSNISECEYFLLFYSCHSIMISGVPKANWLSRGQAFPPLSVIVDRINLLKIWKLTREGSIIRSSNNY